MNTFKSLSVITALLLSGCVCTPNQSITGVVEHVEMQKSLFGIKSDSQSDIIIHLRDIKTKEIYSYEFSNIYMKPIKDSLLTIECNQFACDFKNHGRVNNEKIKRLADNS